MKKFLKTVAMMMALVMIIDTPVSAANVAELGEDRASSTISARVEPWSEDVEPGTNDGTDDGDDWGSVDGKDKVPGQVLAVVVQGGDTRNVDIDKDKTVTIDVDVITNGDPLDKKSIKYDITWEESGDAIKPISKVGTKYTFKPVKGGTAMITVTASNKVSSQSANITVNVAEYAKTISFKKTSYTQYTKQKVDMSEELDKNPVTATDKIYYQIDNTKVATVDAKGVVTPKKPGSYVLTASTERGKIATVNVTVENGKPLKTITLDSGKKIDDMKYGTTKEIKISALNPSDTTDTTFEWTSAKTNFVTIKEVKDGGKTAVIEAVGVGKSTVTVKSAGGKKATVTVTVNPNMAGMSVVDVNDKTSGDAYPKMKLTLTVKPADEYNSGKNTGSFQWKSDNTKVAAVSGKGVVTVKGKAGDTVKITAKDKKSNNEAFYTLTVKASTVDGLSDVKGATTLDVGTQAQYGAVITAGDPSQISWSASGSSLKIDDNGRATAVKAGKATVKATIVNAQGKSISKTLKVTVNQPVLEASFKTPTLVVAPGKKKTVSFKLVVGPKGAKVKNNGDVEYKITQGNNIASIDSKKGKVTVESTAKAGDVVVVEAKMPSGISTTGRVVVVEKGKFDLTKFAANLGADHKDNWDTRKKVLTLKPGEVLELEKYLTVSNTTSTDNTIQTPYTYTLPKNNTAVAVADGKIYGLLSTNNKTVSVKVKAVGGATTTIKVKVDGPSVVGGTTDATDDGSDDGSDAGEDKGSISGYDKRPKDGNDKM